MSKSKNVELTTPIGTLNYCFLIIGDNYKKYSTDLILQPTEQAISFLKQLKELCPKGGRMPVSKQSDGSYLVKIKGNMSFMKDGKSVDLKAPVLYKKNGTEYSREELAALRIGTGTQARLKISVAPYENGKKVGLTLRPISCQIAELVVYTGGNRGFDSLGDDEEVTSGSDTGFDTLEDALSGEPEGNNDEFDF